MKVSEFRAEKITPHTGGGNCGLPMSIQGIIDAFATERVLALPRALTEEYMNCSGLGYKLLNNDWDDYFVEFPWLIAFLVYSISLPLLCIAWCFCQFRRKRRRRFEKSPVPAWRLVLTLLLFLLKIFYCFCLWFTYTSYRNHPITNTGPANYNDNLMRMYYEQTLDAVDRIFIENIEIVHEFMKELSGDMKSSLNRSAPKLIQDPSDSMLLKIYAVSNTIQPLVKSLRADTKLLVADFMQLADLTRFFYRNTTTFLSKGNISDLKYAELIQRELMANEHKIPMLLNIETVLSNIDDVVEMSIGFLRLRAAFTESLNDLQRYYEDYLTNMWGVKVKQIEENYVKIHKAVRKLQIELPRNVIIHLPSDIYSYQLLFIIIAVIIALLCFIQLCYSVYHTVLMRFKKKKYILVSIVVVICISSIILCLIASLTLFVGTSYFNFRRDANSLDNPCGLDTKIYCDTRNRFSSILHADTQKFELEMAVENQRIFETLRDALPRVAGISNILQMLHYANFSEEVFNSGKMFNVVKQELNMQNWYETYERLNLHVPVADQSTASAEPALYASMLSCNLNTMKLHVFETLIAKDITDNVYGMSKMAEILAKHLPMKNLTTLLKQSLSEMRVLHDFVELEFRNLLYNKTDQLLRGVELEMTAYMRNWDLIPNCLELKLPSVGMPKDLYECIEYRLHGFWIGAFAILILLFPILIVCMLLAFLYDRFPYTSQSGRNSRSSQYGDESFNTGSTTTTGNATADDESVSEPSTPKELNWTDQFGPEVNKSHVTFNAVPVTTKQTRSFMDKFSTAKLKDFLYSVINSTPGEPPEMASSPKSSPSAGTNTSEEASEES
ncbi:uncharacterized protein LOC128866342 isoform X1 [Anastrepha ludens]|uniref:uncharacterized protein LOC128866342 isoform X1 n=1 Tax=Anastrepha ludens TaxID=28586 RepID=UPI0023AF6B04|nr:uncharacterized protein LOC128866342 isoform X1 [Anastrepha ludens]